MNKEQTTNVIDKQNEYLKVIDDVIENGKYKDNWESLASYPTPKWFSDAKFGIFCHWGLFSVPEYYSEWYSRLMYYKMTPVYWHHKKTYGKDFHYRQFIEMFKGEKFSPKEWVTLAKECGADYFSAVGEHHDGFKLHKSAFSKWNSVEMALKRDVLAEVKEECEKQNIIFGTSNHRAEHYWFMNGMTTLNESSRKEAKEYPDFYGPCFSLMKRNSALAILERGPYDSKKIHFPSDWRSEWLVHACEQIDLYQPSVLYFDWMTFKAEYRPEIKKFLAYYYNKSIEWGKEVILTAKRDTFMYGCGTYDRERGHLPYIAQEKWQCDTSTAYNAWSYCTTNKWKSAKKIAGTFIDVISKNGVLFLNVCPKADGSFCEEEKQILSKFGKWNEKHKEIIWSSQPFRIYGEGKNQKAGTMKEKGEFSPKDYRFIYKVGHIYAFCLNPTKDKFVIETMRNGNSDNFGFTVKGVSVVGSDAKVEFSQKAKGLHIQINGDVDYSMPICFDVVID